MTNYMKFRGKCKEICEEIAAKNPTLRIVRGHYFCPIWNSDEPHWWLEDQDGEIIDPTVQQFLSNGFGIYTEFDGTVKCSNCGKEMIEEEVSRFESNYAFCSGRCYGQFVGVY